MDTVQTGPAGSHQALTQSVLRKRQRLEVILHWCITLKYVNRIHQASRKSPALSRREQHGQGGTGRETVFTQLAWCRLQQKPIFIYFFSSKAPYHDDLRENCIDVQKITHVALFLFSFLWIQRDVSALCDIKKKQLSGLCVVVEPAKK